MTDSLRKSVILLVAAALLSGCASVKMPNIDFIKLPEFKEEAENIGDYPNVAQAPQRPDDLRSDAQWDKAARAIYAKRDDFGAPAAVDEMTDAEIEQKINVLSRKVDEYKVDDPESLSK